MRLAMLIDLAKCIGCDACSVACKMENSSPADIWWAPVMQKEVGKYPKAKLVFIPTLCMHCEDPPCMMSCPTKAITQRSDGIVLINEDKCSGSKACIAACPYNAISMWERDLPIYGEGQSLTPLDELARQKHHLGSAQKCTFCAHRMDNAKENHLKAGLDREATPACVLACPAECRIFGDIDDDKSPPSTYLEKAKNDGRTIFVLRPEAKTKPKVAYLW
jgi:phenylacetyl-CoA:acceptor oxidoreductase 27-kDa subunit